MPQHQHAAMSEGGTWTLMQDGVVFGLFNRQGGPRGGREFVVPSWWMGMASHDQGRHRLTFTSMLSLDPAMVGRSGYRELFQVGEALDGQPVIDHQHPHDFLMQLAATWRFTISDRTSLSVAGGLAGEPTLGPVAFMHRTSAAGLPFAPLGHHTFDSTHISFGVVAAGLERGRWTVEGSVFNGREPDDHRWDLDLGRMDSLAARVWFRPDDHWSFQVSTGHLRHPEQLVLGDVNRTTASVSWKTSASAAFTAVTMGWGMNAAHDTRRHGVFAEFTTERGANSAFGRLEIQQLEVNTLLGLPLPESAPDQLAAVTALTLGAARRLLVWRGFETAGGGEVTLYRVPDVLKATHGSFPVSAQVFLRIRLPTGPMGRMWDHRMMGH